jgi:hypothetical protein
MITLFSTAKPFLGHVAVIQRNAILSWQRLHPEIALSGAGAASGAVEVCAELGVRHIAEVERNAHGTKYLAGIYDRVHEVARHETLCHVNCDIVLMSDFLQAAQVVVDRADRFLMAGRRWDVDMSGALDFGDADWERKLLRLARETNRQRPAQWIDYFLFSKGLYYRKIPEFVIGRPGWDNWLLWYPMSIKVPVVEASGAVVAVHQNHDYGYHPEGEKGVWEGEEARENYRLHAGKFRTLDDATYVLRDGQLRRNYRRWFTRAREKFYHAWFRSLSATRPLRYRLGLHRRRSDPGAGDSPAQ